MSKRVLAATIAAGISAALAASPALGQALPATITKSFNPSTVLLNETSIGTITVTNPNAFPVSNVQFSDTMPAGIALVTHTGGTCSTVATAGGMFTINPPAGTFSSASTVLTGGQSCDITVQVRGTLVGAHVNTTSQVTATGAPAGGPASAPLAVTPPSIVSIPALGSYGLAMLGVVLAAAGMLALRKAS